MNTWSMPLTRASLTRVSLTRASLTRASLTHFAATVGLALACAAQAQAQNIDMGDASVMSQQGQRLKVAVPFGADAGQKIPLLRFEVASVEAAEGYKAPVARQFTISKPENRNVIFLQSAETVTSPTLKLVLAVAGNPGKRIEYELAVPAATAGLVASAGEGRSARDGRPTMKGKARHKHRRHVKRR